MWNYYIPPAPGTTDWAPRWSLDGRWIVETADYVRKRIGLEADEVFGGESHVL